MWWFGVGHWIVPIFPHFSSSLDFECKSLGFFVFLFWVFNVVACIGCFGVCLSVYGNVCVGIFLMFLNVEVLGVCLIDGRCCFVLECGLCWIRSRKYDFFCGEFGFICCWKWLNFAGFFVGIYAFSLLVNFICCYLFGKCWYVWFAGLIMTGHYLIKSSVD